MNSQSPQQLVKQAMQLQQQGDFVGAKDIYAQILKTTPEHPDALHLYGLACHQLGDYKAAVK